MSSTPSRSRRAIACRRASSSTTASAAATTRTWAKSPRPAADKEFDVDPSFGAAVRFPIKPRWSLEIEMQRFRATNADTFPGQQQAKYEITALPLR